MAPACTRADQWNFIRFTITEVVWNGQQYTAIVSELPGVGSQAVLAVPQQYFAASVRPVQQMITLYILCAAVLGGVISIFFARYSYAPVRRIVRSTGIDLGTMSRKANEYVCIENTLHRYNASNQALTAQIKAMEEKLQINLFIRLLAGTVFTGADMRFCTEKLPLVNETYRLALFFHPEGEGTSEDAMESPFVLLLSAALQHNMEGRYLLSQMDRQSAVVLFPCGDRQEELFAELVQTVQSNFLLLYGENIEVGLSSKLQGVENIRTAYEQARSSVSFASEEGGPLHYYRPGSAPERKIVEFMTLQQLYELILAGETDAIKALFRQVEDTLSKNAAPDAGQEAYAVLRYVVHNVIIDQRLDKKDFNLDAPAGGRSIHTAFADLENACIRICQVLRQRRLSNNQELKEHLLSYIRQHFSESSLYADTIAKELGISEKYVYKLVREHTGQTLNEYVEQLRIHQAMDMLQKTDLSVASIAAACGFNAVNTFYRIFKKYYSVSPSAFRRKKS